MGGGPSFRLLAPDVGQRDIELEVAHCVRGVLSPLFANIALSMLDEHFTAKWEALGKRSTRGNRRRAGVPVMRLVRYADL